jgi:hypothetical protein
MTKSNAVQPRETSPTHMIAKISPADAFTILRQIRLCRSTLGAILEELEAGGVGADAIERIGECTIGVTAEIESLWEAIGKSN